ncbi:hypothetical protein SAMN00017405_0962 [Desulfonispora thiosulfatigenes DSM 11270]|uniref:Uncharacterized protein n=1 Tax=Desulfonispora thiosulfatigenes DSM 11270 TaxID=656914 RepID=A0A1W1UPV0_DESTI|nr:hypothetical protein [Desulfonispora thiosulfatigenes]SMB82734.1 hypothetical protein SAMN00017405_0962 [Desulfonispora thiosulfatigenes DSM 11270]
MSKTKLSIVQILDSDDYDTVVRYGLEHGNFEGVIQVDVPSENSWVDDETEPFLIFYTGKQPAPDLQLKAIAAELVKDHFLDDLLEMYPTLTNYLAEISIEEDSETKRAATSQGKNRPSIESPPNEYLVVEITDPDNFSFCAEQGMKYSKQYSRCLYYLDDQAYLDRHFLIFYNGWDNHPDIQMQHELVQKKKQQQ